MKPNANGVLITSKMNDVRAYKPAKPEFEAQQPLFHQPLRGTTNNPEKLFLKRRRRQKR